MLSTNLQNSIDFKGQKFYVGLDVHKRSWAVTIRSMDIQVAHFTQPPSADALARHLQKNFPGGCYYSAYEAGFCGTTIHEQLRKLGINNMIVHAADMPTTDKQKKNKTDLHDSRSIAQHLEKGNLHGIYVLSREQQELRSVFRLREGKVKDITRANNRLKSALMYFAIVLPESICKKEVLSLKVLNWLSDYEMACPAGRIALTQYVEDLKYQRDQLYQITKRLREQIQAVHLKSYEYLLSVPGIGSITAMGLPAELADFSRFDDHDEYCSLLGLCPWEDSSGDTIKTKGMQPRCNRHLRPLLVEAAWTAIRKSPALFAYYSKHAIKDSKKAIVKVARKLALTARAVVLKQQPYREDHLQKKEEEQNAQKRIFNKRFSSGITERHISQAMYFHHGLADMPYPTVISLAGCSSAAPASVSYSVLKIKNKC
jgi:transposase